jgi:alkylation response protein AidB-like acyl-CoA dehydrogenase
VPAALGGAGATAREAAVVLEELGRAVAPVPFLTSSVIATSALLGTSGDPGRSRSAPLLAELAAGRRTAALVVPLSSSPVAGLPDLARGGTVRSVAGALEADVLLVPAGGVLRSVPTAEATVTPVVSLDMTRQLADVTVPADAGEVLVEDGDAAVRGALEVGAALLASEQYGLAAWCVTETVGYLKQRRQFGRVVGGFQALKHRLADLYCDTEQGLAAARYAAAALTAGTDASVAASLAQAYGSDLAVRAAEEAVQLHGGLGMTWEHPAHLYLKRAKADQIALGSAGTHRRRLAGLVDLPGPIDPTTQEDTP